MADINPYISFAGNCKEAMKFYQECFGGELNMQTFGDTPMDTNEADKDKIMHAHLQGPVNLMGSDGMKISDENAKDRITLSVNCSSIEEIESLFKKFSAKGNITMPLEDTFWGARFGMLTDQFGVKWMFNCEKK